MNSNRPGCNCPRHHVALVYRPNPLGGGFWGCSDFAETGCKVYWSPEHGLRNPYEVVARASSHRSQALSLRQRTIDAGVVQGLPANEVESWIDRDGLDVVRAYLAT